MKKQAIIIILSVFALSVFLVACGGSSNASPEQESVLESKSAEPEVYTESTENQMVVEIEENAISEEDAESQTNVLPEESTEAIETTESKLETVDKDTLVNAVKEAIAGQVGEGEKINGVDFEGDSLIISIDLSDTNLPFASVTKKDIAKIRIDSITNAILDLDDAYYNTWDVVILDFGNEGKAVLNKDMVVDQGLGKYFEYPDDILDN